MIDPIRAPGTSVTNGASAVGGTDFGATRGAAPAVVPEGATDFGTTLLQLASEAANVVRHAEATSVAGVQGKASVQQVVEAVMAAEQTLQGAVAIRDKVVAAYLEISRMQI
jgi:flagellar hook-basal body complex protein FliE